MYSFGSICYKIFLLIITWNNANFVNISVISARIYNDTSDAENSNMLSEDF